MSSGDGWERKMGGRLGEGGFRETTIIVGGIFKFKFVGYMQVMREIFVGW